MREIAAFYSVGSDGGRRCLYKAQLYLYFIEWNNSTYSLYTQEHLPLLTSEGVSAQYFTRPFLRGVWLHSFPFFDFSNGRQKF